MSSIQYKMQQMPPIVMIIKNASLFTILSHAGFLGNVWFTNGYDDVW